MRARERNKDGGKIGAAKALEKKSRTGKKWKVYVRVIESEPRERKRKKETKTERRETKRKIYIWRGEGIGQTLKKRGRKADVRMIESAQRERKRKKRNNERNT